MNSEINPFWPNTNLPLHSPKSDDFTPQGDASIQETVECISIYTHRKYESRENLSKQRADSSANTIVPKISQKSLFQRKKLN